MAEAPDTTGSPSEARGRGSWLNEDWAATILGLVLLALVLIGFIPEGVIP
jgi:hypothetical protein